MKKLPEKPEGDPFLCNDCGAFVREEMGPLGDGFCLHYNEKILCTANGDAMEFVYKRLSECIIDEMKENEECPI